MDNLYHMKHMKHKNDMKVKNGNNHNNNTIPLFVQNSTLSNADYSLIKQQQLLGKKQKDHSKELINSNINKAINSASIMESTIQVEIQQEWNALKISLIRFLKSNRNISETSIQFLNLFSDIKKLSFQNYIHYKHVLLFILEWENSGPFVLRMRSEKTDWFESCIEDIFLGIRNGRRNSVNLNIEENKECNHDGQMTEIITDKVIHDSSDHHENETSKMRLDLTEIKLMNENTNNMNNIHQDASINNSINSFNTSENNVISLENNLQEINFSIVIWNCIVIHNLGSNYQRFTLFQRKFEAKAPSKLLIRIVDTLISDFYNFSITDKMENLKLIQEFYVQQNGINRMEWAINDCIEQASIKSQASSMDYVGTRYPEQLNKSIIFQMKFVLEILIFWTRFLRRPYANTYALRLLNQRFKTAYELLLYQKSDYESRFTVALDIVSHLWKSYGPYLVESSTIPIPFKKNNVLQFLDTLLEEIATVETKRLYGSSLEEKQSKGSIKRNEDLESNEMYNSIVSYCVISFSLIYSKQSSRRRVELIQKLTSNIFKSISLAVQASRLDQDTRQLCVYILREGMLGSEVLKSKFNEMIIALQNDFSEEAESNPATISILAEYYKSNPDHIPTLFGKLDSKSQIERRNISRLLSEILTYDDDLPEDVIDSLSREALNRLHDEDLIVRVNTHNLFSKLRIKYIIPELIKRITEKDERVRSSVIQCLKNLITTHAEPARVLSTILTYIQKISESLSQKDREIVESVITSAIDSFNEESSSYAHLRELIREAHSFYRNNPGNSLYLKIMKKLHNHQNISQHVEEILLVVQSVDFTKFESDDLYKDEAKYLELLSPFLILVSLPTHEFTPSRFHRLEVFLNQGLVSTDQKVRQMCGDLYSRFPPTVYHTKLLNRINSYLIEDDYFRIKTNLFVIFQALQIYESETSHLIWDYANIFDYIFSRMDLDDEELINCQKGAINAYSVLLRNELRRIIHNCHLERKDKSEFQIASSKNELLSKLFDILRDNSLSTSRRICTVNVLTTFALRLSSEKELCSLLDYGLGDIQAIIKDESNNDIILKGSLIHFHLIVTNNLKSGIHPYSYDFISILRYCLSHSDSSMRNAGIKLFSGLILARDDLILDYETEFQDIFKKIKSMSLIEENPESRILAEKFSQLLQL